MAQSRSSPKDESCACTMVGQSMVFERPVGASTDVKELEYIAALHQTDVDLRNDGSIKAIDIVHFLSSRYGIRVTVKEVQETVLRGLGGGEGEEECIDLTEVAAILLIPELVKAAGTPDTQIIGEVLDMILKDTVGSTSARKLDRQLITDIFTAFGEEDLVRDEDLIDEMILAATSVGEYDVEEDGAGTTFDKYSFARALTSDVQSYDVDCETSLTTHYYDVFKTIYSTKEEVGIRRSSLPFWLSRSKDDKDSENTLGGDVTGGPEQSSQSQSVNGEMLENGKEGNENLRPVETAFTFPAIDYVAGTYRSKRFVIALWVCGVATYFAYLWNFQVAFGRVDCSGITKNGTLFGCRIVNGIVNWLVIMVELRSVLCYSVRMCNTISICFLMSP